MIKLNTYLPVIALALAMSFSQASYAKTIKHFTHSYQGVVTGKTTKQGIINKLGKPIKVQKTSNGKNYYYPNTIINISGKQNTVNTITLYKQNRTRDANGIKVGDSIDKVKKLPKVSGKGSWLVDGRHGIIYWHNNRQVVKIVLPASLKI